MVLKYWESELHTHLLSFQYNVGRNLVSQIVSKVLPTMPLFKSVRETPVTRNYEPTSLLSAFNKVFVSLNKVFETMSLLVFVYS